MFVLHGLVIAVEAPNGPLADRVAAVLEHFGARPTPGSPDLVLTFGAHRPEPVGPFRETARHLDVVTLRDDEGLLLDAPGARCRIRADGRVSRTWLEGGSEAQIPLHLLTCLLVNQLRLVERYTLHAGAVAWDDDGCLIVGPSGSGKSTLTLSLVLQGWALLSDDSVVLRPDPLDLLALRRGIYLEPARATATFPQLEGRWQPCPLVEASKLQLRLDGLTERERARPRLVLLPTVEDRDETRFAPVERSEVLYELVCQSRLSELDRDGASKHLAVLAAVADEVRGYRVGLGADVIAHPERVSARIAELLEDR